MQFEHYHLSYAKRHHLASDQVIEFEQLQLASYLEEMVRIHFFSVTEARRRFVNEYPESNRLAVGRTVINVNANTYEYDSNYAFGSVLNLIQPFEDSIWI